MTTNTAIIRRKSKFKYFLIAAIIAAAAIFFFFYRSSKTPETQYVTADANRGYISSVIQSTGTLNAVERVDVGTQISGKIKSIYIDYNSTVKKGDLIAEIDPETQQADVAQYRASYASAQANLSSAEARLVNAEKSFARTKILADKDLIAKAELDAAESNRDVARAQVKASEASVAQSRAALAKAEKNLKETKIYSPVDGVVIAKNVDEGQTVAASYQTPSIAVIAKDLSQMQVQVNVDEADIGGVFKGQRARFTVDAYPNDEFEGSVTQIRLSPVISSNVVTYVVIAKVANNNGKLMPGMTANVSLISVEKDDVLMVPNSAFRFKPVGDDAQNRGRPEPRRSNVAEIQKPAVYLLGKDNKPVKAEVARGISDGVNTEILSGLKEGDRVITGIVIPKEAY
jgi:HlyD family secretion protein